MECTVVIATYGDPHWTKLAERAAASVPDPIPVHRYHGVSLDQARNKVLEGVETEWVVHLDADDELEPGYFDAMARSDADVRGPVARYVTGKRERLWQPRVAGHVHDCTAECLPLGNWLLIGSAVRAELVREIGGWRDFEWSEDWDLWLRCWIAGATFELVPDAVYRAHVRPDSRNRGPQRDAKLNAHRAIYEANFGDGAVPA